MKIRLKILSTTKYLVRSHLSLNNSLRSSHKNYGPGREPDYWLKIKIKKNFFFFNYLLLDTYKYRARVSQ